MIAKRKPKKFFQPKEKQMNEDQSIEQEIQAKGLTAPRITPADIKALVEHHRRSFGQKYRWINFNLAKGIR